MKEVKTNDLSFKIKDDRFIKLLGNLLLHMVKSFISLSIFFLMLSIFIFNLDIQRYHFKADEEGYKHMVIDSQVQIIQALEPIELVDTYFKY